MTVERLDFTRNQHTLKAEKLKFSYGTVTALIGPSGAGKSTFLNLLNGDLTADHLTIKINQQSLDGLNRDQLMFTLQQEEHIFDVDLVDNLTLFGQLEMTPLVDELLELLPSKLTYRLFHYSSIDDLSGGEKQVISILRALNMQRPILLLDEPFSHIDVATKEIIFQFLKEKKVAIILEVTHDLSEEHLARYDQILKIEEDVIVTIR